MSNTWQSEYLSALSVRDSIEQQNKQLYDAYSTLAARKSQGSGNPTAQDDSSIKSPATPPPPASIPSPSGRIIPWSRSVSTTAIPITGTAAGNQSAGTGSPGALPPRWQDDLAAAQRRRAELENELRTAKTELERVRSQLVTVEKRSSELTSENGVLTVKLRDRVDELKAKAKLVQDVHDESVALNLQLNVSEERNAALKQENEQLVQRWMVRVGREADALNEASRF